MKQLAMALAALGLVSLSGCATLEPGERGVMVTMGTVHKDLVKPGITIFNPLTDDVHVYSIKQYTVPGEVVPLTKDQQPITINYRVRYHIPEDRILDLYQNYSGRLFPTLVDPQIQEAFREVVSQYTADQVTGGLDVVQGNVLASVKQSVGRSITIEDIPITHIALPESLQQAILSKQKVEIEAKKKLFELEREKREAEITITKATADAQAIRMKAKAVRQSPEIVKYKMIDVELIKAKRWDGKLPDTQYISTTTGQPVTMFSLK